MAFASAAGMDEESRSSRHAEATVMWRMRRSGGLSTHAVIGLRERGAWVMWFVNDRPLGIRDFEDWESAIRWSDRLQAQNWTVGWRLITDGGDFCASGS
jgi:hypothetical protein